MSSLTTPTTVTTTPTPTPRFGRGTVIAITAVVGVLAVGVVTVPRLTSTTATDSSTVPVAAPSGLGGGAPSPREIAARQREQRAALDGLSSGIRAMDPRAWTAVASAMAAAGAVPRSADAAERWLSPSSLSVGQVPGSTVVVKPTTPDVAERTGTGEPRPPRGMQRPRD